MDFFKTLTGTVLECVGIGGDDRDSVVELPPEPRSKPSHNKTLVRLRACRMWMRREGILTIAGYTPPNGQIGADCLSVWMRHGWTPPSKQAK